MREYVADFMFQAHVKAGTRRRWPPSLPVPSPEAISPLGPCAACASSPRMKRLGSVMKHWLFSCSRCHSCCQTQRHEWDMSVKVIVADLVGRSLPLELPATETVKAIKEAVAASWGLDPCTFHLLVEAERMDEASKLESFLTEMEEITVQLLKFDPLLDLGQFDIGNHEGVQVSGKRREELKKTRGEPDSNNVFLRRGIQEPCFVEFDVLRSVDEMSFGVTYDRHAYRTFTCQALGSSPKRRQCLSSYLVVHA